jgi:hypothetical protein
VLEDFAGRIRWQIRWQNLTDQIRCLGSFDLLLAVLEEQKEEDSSGLSDQIRWQIR